MSVAAIFFYLFAFVLVASAFMVIAARNPVQSVLFLILSFVSAAGLFILIGAEFLALILVVVYVGAVAVLFLFVVMMLDVDFVELRQGFLQYLPMGLLVGVIFLAQLVMVALTWVFGATLSTVPSPTGGQAISNTRALAQVLYTDYVYFFQAAGLVLLVAMIGAIVLAMHHRRNIKRQNVADQVARTPEAAMTVVKVRPGQGL